MALNYAIALGSVAIVNALQAAEYAFIFILTLGLSYFSPRIFYESFAPKHLIPKIIGIGLVSAGVVLLFLAQSSFMRKKIIIFLGIFLAAALVGSYLVVQSIPTREPKTFGVTFSKFFAEKFGLDWKKVFEEIFNDLGVRNVRIPVYWPEIEPEKGKWVFNDYDWQLEKAQQYDAKVVLVIGRKVPRWPECFEPDWAKNLPETEKQKLILEILEQIVTRYRDNPVVWAWQIENEPFLPFGECPMANAKFLDDEILTVKKISDKPVIITDSGEFGIWLPAATRGDIFGSTLYRYVWNQYFGYYTYPMPSWFFRLKQGLVRLFIGREKPIMVVELQAEPWSHKALYELSLAEQPTTMNPERFKEVLQYIKGTGFDTFYFWGVEWWYWMKTQGKPEMWDSVKEAIKNL